MTADQTNRIVSPTTLIGRDQDLTELRDAVSKAQQGHGSFVVLYGEPGVGSSALLDALDDEARALRVCGQRPERLGAYQGLEQLLRPLSVDPKPSGGAWQRLRAALDAEESLVPAAMAVTAILTAAADEAPLLCFLEDAHWIDEQTRTVMNFAGRRLGDLAIAIVMTMPPATRGAPIDVPPDAREIWLEPLAADDAATLLEASDPRPKTRGTTQLLLGVADGYPGALTTVGQGLSDLQLAGREPIDLPIALDSRLEDTLRSGAEILSQPARWVLAAAAACATADLEIVLKAAGTLGIGFEVVDELEYHRYVQLHGRTMAPTRVGVGGAIYHGFTAGQRREIHAALAAAMPDERRGERAEHLALAAAGPDAHVADELLAVAAEAREQGQMFEAGETFVRAAAFTEDRDTRAHRLLQASACILSDGDAGRALSIVSDALEVAGESSLRRYLRQIQAVMHWCAGRISTAVDLVCSVMPEVADADPDAALDLALRASVIASYGVSRAAHDRLRSVTTPVLTRVASHDGRSGDLVAAAFAAGDGVPGPAAHAAARALATSTEDPNDMAGPWLYARGMCQLAIWEFDGAAASFRAGLTRPWGEEIWVAEAAGNLCLAWAEYNRGDFREAAAAATDGLEAALATQNLTVETDLRQVILRARNALGEANTDERLASLLAGRAVPFEQAIESVTAGELAALQGDSAGAALALATALQRYRTFLEIVAHPRYDYVEALIGANDHTAAISALRELEDRSIGLDALLHQARLLRCHAMLASGAAADSLFEQSIALYERGNHPFELARTQLAWGTAMVSRQEPVGYQLAQNALKTFTALGAMAWVHKARAITDAPPSAGLGA